MKLCFSVERLIPEFHLSESCLPGWPNSSLFYPPDIFKKGRRYFFIVVLIILFYPVTIRHLNFFNTLKCCSKIMFRLFCVNTIRSVFFSSCAIMSSTSECFIGLIVTSSITCSRSLEGDSTRGGGLGVIPDPSVIEVSFDDGPTNQTGPTYR